MFDEYAKLRSAFADPPRSSAPLPAWLLNDDLSEEAVRRSLEELASKGIGGVFVHPRAGLEAEYASEEYWEKLRFAVSQCADLGLDVWLADEFNWPSGPVAGKLLAEHPEYRQRHLDYVIVRARAGTPLRIDLPGEFLAARAVCGDDLIDLVAEIDEGKLSWTPPARAQVAVFFVDLVSSVLPVGSGAPWMERERPGYLDVLNGEAVAAFMQRTYAQFDAHLSEYYGGVIKGVCTQDPANYRGWQWTPGLPEAFRARKGYDLLAFLHELAWPVGDYVRTRCDYHQVARDLYVEAYYAPIAAWARERGLSLAGSLFRESDLAHQPGLHGEVFTPLRNMDVPGIRWQGDRHGYEVTSSTLAPAPNLGPKVVSSVAHAGGDKRALMELGGGAGWEVSLAQLRSTVNWALALGIDFIKPHAAFLSIKGMRKRDYPPSHSGQEPWWRYYLDFADYVARLSYLLGRGTHVADIALLYPTCSLWVEDLLRGGSGPAHEIADGCATLTNALLHLQRDFDYLFEEAVVRSEVRVEEGKLVVGSESRSVLVLPPLTAVSPEVLSLARQMVEGGGVVLALGRLPVASPVSEVDRDLLKLIEAIWGARARRLATGEAERLPGPRRERAAERIERIHPGGGRAVFVAWSGSLTGKLAEAILSDLLADGPEPDLVIDSPERRDFVYLHRRVDGAEAYFVVNLGSKGTRAMLDLPALGRIERWDAMSGEITPVLAYRRRDGRLRVSHDFAPGEGLLLVLAPEGELAHVDEERSCQVLAIEDGRAEVRVLGQSPRLQVGEREIAVSSDLALPPLRFRHDWEVAWDGPNVWLLEPWSVRLVADERAKPGEARPARPQEPARLTGRARLTMAALRGARKVVGHMRPAVRSMRTARFVPEDEMTRRAARTLSALGMDSEGLYPHEIVALARELGQESGIGFKQGFLPPGARYQATTYFYADFVPPDLMLVYEDLGEAVEILINDVAVADPGRHTRLWDDSNRVLNLGSRAMPGRNTVTIRSRMPSFPTAGPGVHSLEPVALAGNFMVKGRHIIPPERQVKTGDWAEMGLPHYSGRVTYTQRFRLPAAYLGQDLVLEFEDVHETVEVWLNGENAGYRLWPPYRLPIGRLVREGNNELKIAVTNTAGNLLGRPQPSGLLGTVRIVSCPRQVVSLSEGEAVNGDQAPRLSTIHTNTTGGNDARHDPRTFPHQSGRAHQAHLSSGATETAAGGWLQPLPDPQ